VRLGLIELSKKVACLIFIARVAAKGVERIGSESDEIFER
jgi:hypothetical protein